MEKLISIIVIIVLVGGGFYFWNEKKERTACEDRAQALAVDYYSMDEYPNVAERGSLQNQYEQRYIAQQC